MDALSPKKIEKKIAELKSLLLKKYKVKKIGYFGSFTNNSYHKKSDVDILVEFSEPIGWDFFDLQDFLEEKLNRKVDLVSIKALKKQLKASILKQVKFI